MAITNLKGTTWYVPSGYNASAGYGKFSITYDCTYEGVTYSLLETLWVGYNGGTATDNYFTVHRNGSIVKYISSNDYSITFTFTGGADVTNSALIAWLQENGELQSESIEITYKDTVITINAGQIATLLCADKTMASDVIVSPNNGAAGVFYNGKLIAYVSGEKTAKVICKDKMPTGDIIVIAELKPSEGLVFKQESWSGRWYLNGLGTCTDTVVVVPMCTPEGNLCYRITGNVFRDNKTITSVIIPATVTTLDSNIFYGCSSLVSVKIPKSITSIEGNSFYGCSSLTSVGPVGSGASVEIPDSVTIIDQAAFDYCKGLISVVIPNSVTSIGSYAFNECRSLTSVVIGDSVTTIDNDAFKYCKALTSITIPDSVTSIGQSAFYLCDSLSSVLFGKNSKLESIGDFAFSSCKALTSITIPDSVTSIGDQAFQEAGLQSLSIHKNITSIGNGVASFCDSLVSITVDSANKAYRSANNCIINTATGELIGGCKNSSIPSDGSITSIGQYAFYGCIGLTSVVIPASVTSIGDSAFCRCDDLVSVTFAEGSKLTTIGSYGFANGKFTSIVIPAGVTTIDSVAFNFCEALRSIVIPHSVVSIGSSVFQGCDNFSTIYYTGSEEQWSQINIDSFGNNILNNVTIHYNYTG